MERFSYILFRIFKFIINLLPQGLNSYLAQGLGWLLYHLVKERRELATKNIKRSLNLSRLEAEKLTQEVFQDLALKFIETLQVEQMTAAQLEDIVEVEGAEYLTEIAESDKGAVLFSGHFGNWELLGIYLSALGYPLTAIARDYKNEYIYQEVMKIRQSQGAEVFNRGEIKQALTALLEEKFLLILGDQDAHDEGEFVDFFGRKASTPLGPVKLAQRSDSYLVPVYLAREGMNDYRLIVKEPLEIGADASVERQREVLQKLTKSLEDVIYEYPRQWLWVHKRWKTKYAGAKND